MMLTTELDHLLVCKTCRHVIAWIGLDCPEPRRAKILASEPLAEVLRVTTDEALAESNKRDWFCSCPPPTKQGRLF